MPFITRLKIIFNKENFNYQEGLINPFQFHKTFYILCRIFRVVDDPLPKWTYIAPILPFIFGSLAACLFFVTVIGYIQQYNVPLITEAGTYCIIMTYQVLIASCTLINKPQYHNLMQALANDYKNICTKGGKYRLSYFENQLWTWRTCLVVGVFIVIIGSGMAVCAIIALVYFICKNNQGGVRPLPFPFMAPGMNFEETPTYEIAFVFSIICTFVHVYTYIFMMQTQIVWIRQIMAKADVIIWSLQDLLMDIHPTSCNEEKKHTEDIINARMKEIVKMHHSMYKLLEDYSGVYRKLLMFEQKLCAPVVCLTAYCAAEKIDRGEIPGILLLLCTSVIILVFIPSYMCTILTVKIESISDACIDTPFWNAPGKVLRPYLVLIMQRSMRTLSIQAPGFEEVSLETFSNKMTFAYSCFNMLRQADYEI